MSPLSCSYRLPIIGECGGFQRITLEYAMFDPFLLGILCNWGADLGKTGVVTAGLGVLKLLPTEDLSKLLQNEHLRRVAWVAEWKATEAVCAHWLDPLESSSAAQALFRNPEVRVVVWWVMQSRDEAERASASESKAPESKLAVHKDDLQVILRIASELEEFNDQELGERFTRDWVAALDEYSSQHREENPRLLKLFNEMGYVSPRQLDMPASLRKQLEDKWFGLFCRTFRELLRSRDYPEARHGFELDFLIKLGATVTSIDEALRVISERDDERWQEYVARADGLVRLLEEQLQRLVELQLGLDALRGFASSGLTDYATYERGYWEEQQEALDKTLHDHHNADHIKQIIQENLIGRDEWLRGFEQFLDGRNHCTFVLDGLTGCGKSRIVLAGTKLAAERGFHVAFVANELDDPRAVIDLWLRDVPTEIGRHRVLLVWDNCSTNNEAALMSMIDLPRQRVVLAGRYDIKVVITCWPDVGRYIRRMRPESWLRAEELPKLRATEELREFVRRVNPLVSHYHIEDFLTKADHSMELLLTLLTSIDAVDAALLDPRNTLHERYQRFIAKALRSPALQDVEATPKEIRRALRRAAIIDWQRDDHRVREIIDWEALDIIGIGQRVRDSLALSIIRASVSNADRDRGVLPLTKPHTEWPRELGGLLWTHFDEVVVKTRGAFRAEEHDEADALVDAIFEAAAQAFEVAVKALKVDGRTSTEGASAS